MSGQNDHTMMPDDTRRLAPSMASAMRGCRAALGSLGLRAASCTTTGLQKREREGERASGQHMKLSAPPRFRDARPHRLSARLTCRLRFRLIVLGRGAAVSMPLPMCAWRPRRKAVRAFRRFCPRRAPALKRCAPAPPPSPNRMCASSPPLSAKPVLARPAKHRNWPPDARLPSHRRERCATQRPQTALRGKHIAAHVARRLPRCPRELGQDTRSSSVDSLSSSSPDSPYICSISSSTSRRLRARCKWRSQEQGMIQGEHRRWHGCGERAQTGCGTPRLSNAEPCPADIAGEARRKPVIQALGATLAYE